MNFLIKRKAEEFLCKWESLSVNQQRMWIFIGFMYSFGIRLLCFPFVSKDMEHDMIPWSEFIQAHGAWNAWGHGFLNFNYPPLYLYLLTLAAWLPLPRLYAIKTIYVGFDYLLAWFTYKIVRQRYPTGPIPILAGFLVLFLPTVVMNSSLWGQCDAMYASGLLGCVYFLMRNRSFIAMIAYGLAWSLKPQAIFLAPLIAILIWQLRVPPSSIYIVPMTYVMLAVPCFLAGRSFLDIVLLYAEQKVQPFPALTLGGPNLYQWFDGLPFQPFFKIGVALAGMATLSLLIAVNKRFPENLDARARLQMAQASLLLMPYVLPTMHERYFFAADALSIAYACWVNNGWIVALLTQTASVFAYLPFLFHKEPLPGPFLALVLGCALIIAIKQLIRPGQIGNINQNIVSAPL